MDPIRVGSPLEMSRPRSTRSRAAAHQDGDPALVDRLAATIRSRVLAGEIPTGSWLRQESLAAQFGVSRTPVREALRKLQATGLVQLEPNRGAVVRGLTEREIREAYEVRAELEGLAAELACERIREPELERLREAVELSATRRAGRSRAGSGRTTCSTRSSRRPRGTSACGRRSATCTSASRGISPRSCCGKAHACSSRASSSTARSSPRSSSTIPPKPAVR